MSYTFKPNRYYRMPTHFGPSLGPRQGIDGRRYANIDTTRDLSIQAVFTANPQQLENLLPPGFCLREPHTLTVTFGYGKDFEWLAGRGYNIFGISVPATYNGEQNTVHGDLQLVLWENMADPIITGRDDLGFAKLYCEIPEAQWVDDNIICRASWDGCEFASLKLSGLQAVPIDDLPEGHPSDGTLHYKYIPKTGAPGVADVEYAVLTPADWSNVVVEQTHSARSTQCHFRHSTWEELPTLVHIVNTLSALTLGDCIAATVMRTHGSKDLSDQRILS